MPLRKRQFSVNIECGNYPYQSLPQIIGEIILDFLFHLIKIDLF
jgi:hypothetical protein